MSWERQDTELACMLAFILLVFAAAGFVLCVLLP